MPLRRSDRLLQTYRSTLRGRSSVSVRGYESQSLWVVWVVCAMLQKSRFCWRLKETPMVVIELGWIFGMSGGIVRVIVLATSPIDSRFAGVVA